ncbi:hypothetical protein LTR37_017263 [Vermiconidia calcicola]|uniref:Uncharacterized protein n=1 Tax=Vermiconidia calcicola TaxID=1690605 RepID=A0ACC3ML73_9PEZI|nr:hypothetical protein LTR37_017263 [Vermiconidia calcicola]
MKNQPDGPDGHQAQSIAHVNDARAADERPLLRSFPNPSGYGTHYHFTSKGQDVPNSAKLKRYLNADIGTRWADMILVVCFFISGLIDAGAYNAYGCFSSMQTGNTVFAALGVSDLPVNSPPLAWTKSVCSIVCYLLGSVATSSFHRSFGERKRWVMTASFALQTIFVIVPAILVQRGSSSESPPGDNEPSSLMLPADPGFPWADLIPIGLLSFQAAGKVMASRILQYNAMPCVVLTTLYTDLVTDPGLLSAGLYANPQRNRRAGGVVFYFIGAVIGGVAASKPIGFSGGLWIASVIQGVIAMSWLAWREDTAEGDEEG